MPLIEVVRNKDKKELFTSEYRSAIVLNYSSLLDTNGQTTRITSRKDMIVLFSFIKQALEECRDKIHSKFGRKIKKSFLGKVKEIDFFPPDRKDAGNYTITVDEDEVIGDIIICFSVTEEGKLKWGVFSDNPEQDIIIMYALLFSLFQEYALILNKRGSKNDR